MRTGREAGSDPAFLRKALGEAAGELHRLLAGLPRSLLLQPGPGQDDCWSLLAIAVHLRDCEKGFLNQLEAFLSESRPLLQPVDTAYVPSPEDVQDEDEDLVLSELLYLRRTTAYLLWDLYPSDWARTGEHPYLGPVSLRDTARGMYMHDLEHLWQARRLLESLAGPA